MRLEAAIRSILILTLVVIAFAAPAQKRTVGQLRDMLSAQSADHKSDDEIARKAAAVELTEQLTTLTLAQIKAELHAGPKTSQALNLLGDVSAPLNPPQNELAAKDAPDAESRDAMIQRAMQFALVTMHRMPDFLATRETRSFDDAPVVISLSGWYPAHIDLHLAGTFSQQITYRNGQEAVDEPADERSKQKVSPTGLASSGEFGPILAVALTDALKGKLSWGYWEVTENGTAAVFHFQVSRQNSHYAIRYCCFFADRKLQTYTGKPAYHGSLSIDPVTGAVLRIVMQSDVVPSDPLSEALISVRYGDVEIGGRNYVCPVRSAAISLIRLPTDSTVGRRSIRRVNESTFLHYRRFGSTARIVPDLPKR